MKDDERMLWDEVRRLTRDDSEKPYIRKIVADIGMNERRASYILEKWCSKGWLECGVSPFAGWLTELGLTIERTEK